MTERGRLHGWERGLVFAGCAALGLLLWQGNARTPQTAVVALATALYAGSILWFVRVKGPETDRPRAILSYLFVLWFYEASSRMVPLVGLPVQDSALLRIDRWLFGTTPAVLLARSARPWLTEIMSACYAGYLVYLHATLGWAFVKSPKVLRRWGFVVMPGFVAGFCGYLLFPALGPATANPELFPPPQPTGLLTHWNQVILAHGNAIYGVFPSLHVLITVLILRFDWEQCRTRFWIVLAPALGLIVSTLYLGFHYGVDVLAAGVIYLVLQPPALPWKKLAADGKR